LTVDLEGVPNGHVLEVTFPGIAAVGGLRVSGSLRFGVLAGDVDGNGHVDIDDLIRVRDCLGPLVDERYSQQDPRVSGCVDIFDLVFVRNHLGRTLPSESP